MATTESINTVSLIAGAAFAAGDFGKLVEIDSSASRTVTIVNGLADTVVGVLAEVPVLIGQAVPVALLAGILKVQAGAGITAGQILVPAADGQVTGVANIGAILADVMGVGIALEDGVDGQIIEMLAMPLTSATETP